MDNLVLHPVTQARLERAAASPPHAILLAGPKGSGKLSVAQHLATQILQIPFGKLATHPYFVTIEPADGKAIPIETIRELQHFTTLRIPGKKGINPVKRVVIIDSAHMMTTEAQNALLKSLEEPPLDTVFILTATSADSVLPTIQSRVNVLQLTVPDLNALKSYLMEKFKEHDVNKAILISGGLPGLAHALLTSPEDHPLYEATVQARSLLQGTPYDRLLLVDALSKQKQLCVDVTFILGQMARMALLRSAGTSSSMDRWNKIMKAAFAAQENLAHNTQTKLILMNLMLEM